MSELIILRNESDSYRVFEANKNAFYSPRGVGNSNPKSSLPGDYLDNVTRFDEGVRGVYGKNSQYATGGPFFSFGFREPYVWTSLNDSDFKKFIKRRDGRGFPIGSTLQDVERLAKFTVSGRGIFWLVKQQLLHMQSPFDENNFVDPTSHLISAARPATFGILPRVTKHVSGGSAIGKLLSLVGVKNGPGEPKSTVQSSEALSEKVSQQDHQFGLLRGNTATDARKNLTSVWAPKPDNSGGGFLDSLLSSLKSKFLGSFLAKQPEFKSFGT